jgi:hypothetical protein
LIIIIIIIWLSICILEETEKSFLKTLNHSFTTTGENHKGSYVIANKPCTIALPANKRSLPMYWSGTFTTLPTNKACGTHISSILNFMYCCHFPYNP